MSSNDDETAPLLDPQNGTAKQQGQKKFRILLIVAHVLGFLVLIAFAVGFYLGNVWNPFKPHPGRPKTAPVCNLDNIEGVTQFFNLPLEGNFRIFNIWFDEGIVGNVVVHLHEDWNRTDIAFKWTVKFSDPSIKPYYDPFFIMSSGLISTFSSRFNLDLTLDQRQSLLYDQHQCVGVDLEVTFPLTFANYDQLNIFNRYKGNIDIRTQRLLLFNLLTVKTAYGDIYMRHVNAIEMTLEAPGGAIDAIVYPGDKLETYSGEDTTIAIDDYLAKWPYWTDMGIVSEKRVAVKYPYKAKFLMQSATRPLVTGHQDVVVNITREDEHTTEGLIGEYWELIHSTPRLVMRGHDTVLELKQPNPEQEVWRGQGGRHRVTKFQSVSGDQDKVRTLRLGS
ncbi:hypothetical protein BGZ59_004271 [Podila verticillata]|nr:hypothetical protein BGZ59_004271 [Podila verticillata]